jgi:hypothetical protein
MRSSLSSRAELRRSGPPSCSTICKENSGSGPYRAIVDAWVKASSTEVGAANPADIANLISRAVTSSWPKPRYVALAQARIFLFLRWILSDRAFDRLWAKLFRLPARIS